MTIKPKAAQHWPSVTLGMLLEHEGYLAQFRGEWYDPERPVLCVRLAVSDLPADRYPKLLGRVPSGQNWSGTVSTGWVDVQVLTTDWPTRVLEEPVRKPRAGREYDWYWQGERGRWAKAWHPQCPVCSQWHRPGRCPDKRENS